MEDGASGEKEPESREGVVRHNAQQRFSEQDCIVSWRPRLLTLVMGESLLYQWIRSYSSHGVGLILHMNPSASVSAVTYGLISGWRLVRAAARSCLSSGVLCR